jgi:hypothetical protein
MLIFNYFGVIISFVVIFRPYEILLLILIKNSYELSSLKTYFFMFDAKMLEKLFF